MNDPESGNRNPRKDGRLEKTNQSQGSFCRLCGAWRGCYGLEPTIEMYVEHTVEICRELRRVLRRDGVMFWNVGDSYASNWGMGAKRKSSWWSTRSEELEGKGWGTVETVIPANSFSSRGNGVKVKDLCLIPQRVAIALQADGWWVRSCIIWAKGLSFCDSYSGSVMPESVKDRPTTSHEYVWMLTRSARYYWDGDAVREKHTYPEDTGRIRREREFKHLGVSKIDSAQRLLNPAGRNLRTVWAINPESFTGWTQTSRLGRVELDEVSDGMMRIPFPDCPVHDHQDRLNGERVTDNQSYNAHTDAGHVQELDAGLACNSKCPCELKSKNSSDSRIRDNSPSATDHSKQSRKTARVPETSPSCTPCAETDGHIERTSESRGSSGPDGYNAWSNTWPDEMAVHSLDETLHHIVDKSSLPVPPECLCIFYHKFTKNTSHFATFPTKLIIPMIKAATSEKGVCPKCQMPWKRVVEKTGQHQARWKAGASVLDSEPLYMGRRNTGVLGTAMINDYRTLGWEPGCECFGHFEEMDDGEDWITREGGPRRTRRVYVPDGEQPDPVPAIVLDPFVGSGTSVMVALRLGRRALGIDVSESYAAMARKRVIEDAPLWNWQNVAE